MNVYINNLDHMTKPINGKNENFKNLLWDRRTNINKAWYVASGTVVLCKMRFHKNMTLLRFLPTLGKCHLTLKLP